MQQFNTYRLQEMLQIILVHQFVRGYLISEEYFFLYANLIIKKKIPISASVYGEDCYIREDEKFESYLHPSDIFAVNIPVFWKELFYNELQFHSSSYVTNFYIPKAVYDNLLRDPANTTTKLDPGQEAKQIGIDELEGLDKLPP